MEWLDEQTLDAIYDAAVAADLVDRDTRAVLLQSLADDVRLALPDLARPDRQFRSDINLLNVAGDGGAAPLRGWLEEASGLTLGRPQNAVFAAALARPDRPVGSPEAPTGEPDDADSPQPMPTDEPVAGPQSLPREPRRPSGADTLTIGGIDVERRWLLAGLGGALAVGVGLALFAGRGDDDAGSGGAGGGPVGGSMGAGGVAGAPDRGVAAALIAGTRYRPALVRLPQAEASALDPRLDPTGRFAMAAGPVTRAQYDAVLSPDVAAEAQSPAVGLTLADARAYCDALSRVESRRPFYSGGNRSPDGYRLPTVELWRGACEAGRGRTPHPWGFNALPASVMEWTDSRRVEGGVRQVTVGGEGGCAGEQLMSPVEGGAEVGFRVVRPLSAVE